MRRRRFNLAEYEKHAREVATAEWLEKARNDPQAAWRELAANSAEDSYRRLMSSRRGTYAITDAPTASGQVICLYNNNPYQKWAYTDGIARRDMETNLFRNRMREAGISELGYSTYPPPGVESAGYSYAMILDAGPSLITVIHDAMRQAMNVAWESFKDKYAALQLLAPPRGHSSLAPTDTELESVSSALTRAADKGADTEESAGLPHAVTVGEVLQTRKVRTGQDAFSRAVRDNYSHRCCFPGCEVDHDALLEAAHIDPFNLDSGGNIDNGLCLCVLHHKAFDAGFFTLSDDLHVDVNHRNAPSSTWVKTNLQKATGMRISTGRIRPSLPAVRQHRERHRV